MKGHSEDFGNSDTGRASESTEALLEQLLAEQQLLLEELERARERTLQDSQDQLAIMAAELTLSGEQARRHIAQQLHDQVVQKLALGKIKLDMAVKRQDIPDCPAARELSELLISCMADLRDLSFDLSPPVLHELGLAAAIDSMGTHLAREHGFTFEFPQENQEPDLGQAQKIALFQFARELIINVVKHAAARRVVVELKKEKAVIRLSVSDDGAGFSPVTARKGFGLASVKQRALFMGGLFEIQSRPGAGTRVELALPVRRIGTKQI
jgi:signal transduction histidine kinase